MRTIQSWSECVEHRCILVVDPAGRRATLSAEETHWGRIMGEMVSSHLWAIRGSPAILHLSAAVRRARLKKLEMNGQQHDRDGHTLGNTVLRRVLEP